MVEVELHRSLQFLEKVLRLEMKLHRTDEKPEPQDDGIAPAERHKIY